MAAKILKFAEVEKKGTRLSQARKEKNRLVAQVADLKVQNRQLEEQHIEVSSLECKYRTRTQDLKERLIEEQRKVSEMQAKLDRIKTDGHAISVNANAEKLRHAQAHMETDQKLKESLASNKNLEEIISDLKHRLKAQHQALEKQNNLMSKQLPLIIADIENVKNEQREKYEAVINEQREKYEAEVTSYKIIIAKSEAKTKGIQIGRKKQFDDQRIAERMEMKRLQEEERSLHEERLRQQTVDVGAVDAAQAGKGEAVSRFDRPGDLLNLLLHRLPSSSSSRPPPLAVRSSMNIGISQPTAMVNFQLAMSRLRSFDEDRSCCDAASRSLFDGGRNMRTAIWKEGDGVEESEGGEERERGQEEPKGKKRVQRHDYYGADDSIGDEVDNSIVAGWC